MGITINQRHTVAFESGVKVYVRGLTAAEYHSFLKTVKIPVLPLKPPLDSNGAASPVAVVGGESESTAPAPPVALVAETIAPPAADAADGTDTTPMTLADLPNKIAVPTMRACLQGVIGGDGFLYAEYDADGNETTVPVPAADITGDWLIDNTDSSLVDAVLAEIMTLTNLSAVQKKISQSP